jgi:hypothetical protein
MSQTEEETTMSRNEVIFDTIAKTMNATGSAIVSAFDAGASAFNCTMSALSPGERSKLRDRIKVLEKKIQALYAAIGKETSKFDDPAAALESESVIATLADIKEYNNEIEQMKQRIAEIDIANREQESAGVAKFISHSISGFMPGEKASIERKIYGNEKKIQELYCDFAKETAKQSDPSAAIASEPVIGIIAKINELKAENDSLKLRITGLSGTKTDKPKPVEKKSQPADKRPQPESTGVTKFFIRAISDSISGYLPSQNQRTVETSDDKKPEEAESKEQVPKSVDISSETGSNTGTSDDCREVFDSAGSQHPDSTVIGFTRTKPCQISTPSLQPPTREDIETVTRVLQADAVQEELPTADAEVSGVSEEAAATIQEAPEPVETLETAEIAEIAETSPEPVVANAPADVVENSGTDDTPEDTAASEEVVNPLVEEAVPVEPVTEENSQVEPADEEKLPVEPAAEEYVPVAPAVPEGEFESIRTRSHSTSFAASMENPIVIQTPDLKPEAVFVDESWPVFHTRVRHAVSTDAADPTDTADTAEISDEGESDKQKEKRNGKKWVAPQKHFDIKKRR